MRALGAEGSHLVITGLNGTTAEEAVVGLAVLSFLGLLLLRAKRSRDRSLRLGSSTGYYDRDVARYVHSPSGSTAGPAPLAPSFTSVPKGLGRRHDPPAGEYTPAPVPQPVPSFPSFPSFATATESGGSGSLPAFDPSPPFPVRTLPGLPPPPPRRAGTPMPGLPTPDQPKLPRSTERPPA